MKNEYINIKAIAQAKDLKSTRSIRMEINKPESKYISREVKVNGGTSYEILFSSLEPELQQKLRENETKSTALVPLNYKPPVITDKARITANHRMNIVKAALEHRKKYDTQKQADHEFLELYNTGLFLPKAYEFLGSISMGTLRRYIQAYLKSGNTIILESTSPVGTTEIIAQKLKDLRPDLKIPTNENEDGEINIAYCPERMIPGNVFELVKNDRIIGGINSKSCDCTKQIYALIAEGQLICTNSKTAEMSKLTENSFRDVNIAFANELSIICDKLNIDVFELIKLANHHPRVNILPPGCGVGGHCIAVDPWFIISKTPEQAKLMHTARLINDYKPEFILNKVDEKINKLILDGKSVKDIKIACLGLSFKPDIDDLRESPAIKIASALSQKYQNQVISIEPHIKELPPKYQSMGITLGKLDEALNADIIVPLVKHKMFVKLDFSQNSDKLVDYIGLHRINQQIPVCK